MSDAGYSSDEDQEDLTVAKSQVVLGFVDVEISEDEQPTLEDTFVGGQPIWLHKDSKPDEKLLKCLNCESDLALLMQAFAPLDGELYDRVIYIFTCLKTTCNRKKGSVRAIRGLMKDPAKIKEMEKKEQEEMKSQLDEKLKLDNSRNFLFGGDQSNVGAAKNNPFSNDSNPFSVTTANPFTATPTKSKQKDTFASIATKAAPPKQKQTKKIHDSKLPELPGFILYTDEERFKKIDRNKLPDGVQIDENALDLESELNNSGNAQVNADYSKLANSLTDEDFQKFSDLVSHNPLQVLRYDLGGNPLLYSTKDDTGLKILKGLIPKPGYNPSSSRRFELQVMPKLIIDFENKLNDSGMEWVTIIVYTDTKDFIPNFDSNHVGYVEEWCGVQWEETTK